MGALLSLADEPGSIEGSSGGDAVRITRGRGEGIGSAHAVTMAADSTSLHLFLLIKKSEHRADVVHYRELREPATPSIPIGGRQRQSYSYPRAGMAELVDAQVSKTCSLGSVGSIPTARTSFPRIAPEQHPRPYLLQASRNDEPWRGCLCRLGFEAGVGQLLEATGIVDGVVAEVLQGLAAQCGASTRSAVDQDRLVLLKSRIVIRALGIGAEFQHTP